MNVLSQKKQVSSNDASDSEMVTCPTECRMLIRDGLRVLRNGHVLDLVVFANRVFQI